MRREGGRGRFNEKPAPIDKRSSRHVSGACTPARFSRRNAEQAVAPPRGLRIQRAAARCKWVIIRHARSIALIAAPLCLPPAARPLAAYNLSRCRVVRGVPCKPWSRNFLVSLNPRESGGKRFEWNLSCPDDRVAEISRWFVLFWRNGTVYLWVHSLLPSFA